LRSRPIFTSCRSHVSPGHCSLGSSLCNTIHRPAVLQNRFGTSTFLFHSIIFATGSSVSTVKRLWAEQAGFNFSTASRPTLETTQPPVQWAPRALSQVVQRPRREADHSTHSGGEVKSEWSYTSTPPYVFMVWKLIKQQIRLHGVVQGEIYLTLIYLILLCLALRCLNLLYLTLLYLTLP
jgi:hypothetical protein